MGYRGVEAKEFPPTLYEVRFTEGELGFLAGLVQPRLVHSTILGQALAKSIWGKLEKATDKVVQAREKSIAGRVKIALDRKVVPVELAKGLVEANKHGKRGEDLPEAREHGPGGGSLVQAADKPPDAKGGEEGSGRRPREKTDPGVE